MQHTPHRPAPFDWADPFLMRAQLTDEERQIGRGRETEKCARGACGVDCEEAE